MSASWHGQEGAVHTTAREVRWCMCAACVCVCLCSRGVFVCVTWRVLIFLEAEAKGPINKHAQERESFCLRQLDVIREWIRAPRLHNEPSTHGHECTGPIQSQPATLRQRTFTLASPFNRSLLQVDRHVSQKIISLLWCHISIYTVNYTIHGKCVTSKG